MPNQNPEQIARDKIDEMLKASGWIVQGKQEINMHAGIGIAVREFQTDVGPVDYLLFVDKIPIGVLEAKSEDEAYRLNTHENQAIDYSQSQLKYFKDKQELPFIYLSTGSITKFMDIDDPKPRFREIFSFHRPETLKNWYSSRNPLRKRLQNLPILNTVHLRECQIQAILNLDVSLKNFKPRSLIQMATGSGKTFTAISAVYRLLKHCNAKRILFLVDTRNLGEQAEQEFISFLPNDDNRKFTELYNVIRLQTKTIPKDCQVYISTIQRLYAVLKGKDLPEGAEDVNPAEIWKKKEPMPVEYYPNLPVEFFDFIIIDECHRSIYNVWQQVLDYFDAFLIGLTATPDKRTYAFFEQNVVSQYTHQDAVADGVNVGYDTFLIETEIGTNGAKLYQGNDVLKREKWTRKQTWERLDDDISYTARQLDRDVVNKNQIRTVIQAFKDSYPQLFPDREELPKTLIFAKDDSHAEDIISITREVFNEDYNFCKKITYKASEEPKSLIAQLRNDYNPRIAVTVDLIATGTDVKPLEILIFMRDVRSRNYFEQMKGRGTRTLLLDDLRKVTPSAKATKDHFVIIDAVGVSKSTKTDSRPLDRKPGTPLKNLLESVAVGVKDEDLYTSLASRLARLDNAIPPDTKAQITELIGAPISKVVKDLLSAYDEDSIEDKARMDSQLAPDAVLSNDLLIKAQESLADKAQSYFTGQVASALENARKTLKQVIDTHNPDTLLLAEWSSQTQEAALHLINEFYDYIHTHKAELAALQFFYSEPYSRRELNLQMVKELLHKLKRDKPQLIPVRIWQAYELLDGIKQSSPKNELVTLVSLVRRAIGLDDVVTPLKVTVDKNFKDWVFAKQAGALKFNKDQMAWLRMIKDHIVASFSFCKDDLAYAPFIDNGGLDRMLELFGEQMDKVIEEMNTNLIA